MRDAEKPALKQANDNPWYCLATLYGEQPKDVYDRDPELAARNRIAWNRWMSGALSAEKRTELASDGFPESDLEPFSQAEESEFRRAFAVRSGHGPESLPDPNLTADFRDTHFDRNLNFSGFLFSGDAKFHWATFSGDANFEHATFSGTVSFMSGTFSGDADFQSAKFPDDANFESATFSSFAYFKSATFPGWADFGSAMFSGETSFESVTFSSFAHFRSATFSDIPTFINAAFAADTIFADARFESEVPDFRGANMHEATEWHGADWPSAPKDKHNAQRQVYAYERLKQEMERLKKHEDEQRFFRMELRARRGTVPCWSGEWLLNLAYQATSDYGYSVSRPLVWLAGLFAIGVAVFATAPVSRGARMEFWQAAGLSFANIFSFLPISREILSKDVLDHLSTMAKIVGVAQSLLSAPLFFLLALALRSRFRMR